MAPNRRKFDTQQLIQAAVLLVALTAFAIRTEAVGRQNTKDINEFKKDKSSDLDMIIKRFDKQDSNLKKLYEKQDEEYKKLFDLLYKHIENHAK